MIANYRIEEKSLHWIMKEIVRETLINSANGMRHGASGTQQLRPINTIGEGVSTAQRSDSLAQPINQRFLRTLKEKCFTRNPNE